MMYLWKPDMIKFMRDACEYGDYNKVIIQAIERYLTPDSHVCDAGCGIGYLSLELSQKVARVTSIDKNRDALDVLRENCAKCGVENINIICGDLFETEPKKPYDAMVFCYFGDIDDILSIAKKQCNGPICVITRNSNCHSFSIEKIKHDRCGHLDTCKKLKEKGIPYEAITLENDFGQPFRTIEDAKCFFELYSNDEDKSEITEDVIREKLISTGRDDFPWYLSNIKKIGCIIINTQDVN